MEKKVEAVPEAAHSGVIPAPAPRGASAVTAAGASVSIQQKSADVVDPPGRRGKQEDLQRAARRASVPLVAGLFMLGTVVGVITATSGVAGISQVLLTSVFTFTGGVLLTYTGFTFRKAPDAAPETSPDRVGFGLLGLTLGILAGIALGLTSRVWIHNHHPELEPTLAASHHEDQKNDLPGASLTVESAGAHAASPPPQGSPKGAPLVLPPAAGPYLQSADAGSNCAIADEDLKHGRFKALPQPLVDEVNSAVEECLRAERGQ